MTPPFERTSCACDACVACCRRQPGPLAPGDLERVAAHLGQGVAATSRLFWASPGAVLRSAETGETRTVGTITPRLDLGRCVFLTADDRCGIHAVAPFGCACFDTHMAAADWVPRARWLYASIERDTGYARLRGTLARATSWRPR